MEKTNEQWPYELFGIECGDGWKSLYQPLIDYVENYNQTHQESSIEIHQIKEKFGGLRVYWMGDNISKEVQETFTKMVRDAEARSYTVCEQCGATEKVGIACGGWYYTVCLDCLKKMVASNSREYKWKYNDKIYLVNKQGVYEFTK